MRRIPRPSPATVIAMIALIVAIGGTAYATGEGKPLLGGARNPGSDKSKSLSKETQIIASDEHVRHAPVEQVEQRRRRDLRLPLGRRRQRRRQGAVHPREQPLERLGLRVRDDRQRPAGLITDGTPTACRSRRTPRASRPASTPTASTA